ncbi:histidine phosphatase family protein (plasmid) [Pseudomonas frederiksbergensis]|uniref:Histidine phosphatase family protein n=1 Tax=Pseudomonas frederiksbergensis TaxID=104087 RepID=A0A1J0EUG9_9PSED|nr:histidine phosphatase family protein [Pseudomonas frederiksbergensis]APC19543.1 histidine phosphatase family protein [Pseudomonas frederiksbergensis]
MNITPLKAILSIGFVGVLVFAYDALTRNTVEDLGPTKKLARSGLSNDWKKGNVIVLIRHEERCDRSTNPCLGPDNGITALGSERAKEFGIRLKTYFELDNTDIFTSPMTRTVQTSDFMLGKASLLSDRETICGSDIIDKLLKHKTTNRNLLVVTHYTCMTDLIRTSGHTQSWNPQYGSLLFAKITSDNGLQIIGKLNPGDLPKQPPAI